MNAGLPAPGHAARAHSDKLTALIGARIAAAGRWVSFADYMQMALYEPGLGYYSAGATKFGADGDFVTAPEISPLFSRSLARQCADVLTGLGGGVVLEPGAGTGSLAVEMLREFATLGIVPERYCILETSAELRARQAERIAQLPNELSARVEWLEALPAQPVRGVIVANEVADALPVRRFTVQGERILELGVTHANAQLKSLARPASTNFATAVRQAVGQQVLADGYCSEFSEQLPGWLAALLNSLNEGLLLLFDYGFAGHEYYLPERSEGTLRCYYRQRAHDNPYYLPGLQDITAWVDFSRCAEAAVQVGANVAGYTTQAQFLLAGGIEALLSAPSDQPPAAAAALASGLRRLVLPGEMGEAIKVMGLSKGDVVLPSGFNGRDLRARL